MPPGHQECGHQLAEAPEEESLMASSHSVGGEDTTPPENKAAWNGSVSHNWANRITQYRDTITEDSPTLINGNPNILMNDNGTDMCSLVCNNQVEAEVIVHSELSDPERAHGESCSKREDSSSTRGLSLSEDGYPHLSQCSPPREEGPPEKLSVAQISSSLPLIKLVSNHNGELEATEGELTADSELQRDTVLTNGFHSPETVRSVLRSEPLENGESRHCPTASGKAVTVGLAPAPFISSGLVHPTSAVHTYLCP